MHYMRWDREMKPGTEETRGLRYYLAAAIAFLTFLVYLPALKNEFLLWDDNSYVFENPHISSFDLTFFKWLSIKRYAAAYRPRRARKATATQADA